MDALERHLDELADFGTVDSRGSFTLDANHAWERLEKALVDGQDALRFCLRWLHRFGAANIDIQPSKRSKVLTLKGALSPSDRNLHSSRDADFDLSGKDVDLARGIVSFRQLEFSTMTLECCDGANRRIMNLFEDAAWERQPSQEELSFALTVTNPGSVKKLFSDWRKSIEVSFRHSPIPIFWDGKRLSGPYTFSSSECPVWRHLRAIDSQRFPVTVRPPTGALESYHAKRHQKISVVLGLSSASPVEKKGGPPPPLASFHLLYQGEMLPLETSRNLAGFEGFLRVDDQPLTLEGRRPVLNQALKAMLGGLKEEALDMVVQLYRSEPPASPEILEKSFLGIKTVLLYLLDQQRFVEGFQICQWLMTAIEESSVLEDFRTGYTFDKIMAMMAEPAGQPQTAIRFHRRADKLVSQGLRANPGLTVEALMIAASLEIRARNGQAERLTSDTQNRLLSQAIYCSRQNRLSESATLYRILGQSLPPDDNRRWRHLIEAGKAALASGTQGRRSSVRLFTEVQGAIKAGHLRPSRDMKVSLQEWESSLSNGNL